MKKLLGAVCVLLALCAVMLPAFAQEAEETALSYDELMAWVAPYLARAQAQPPLNAPVGEEALSADGYAYIYDFATLYFDKPTLDENTKLNAIVVLSETEQLPRGVNIDASFDQLIKAFYCENDALYGTHDFAYLYLSDTMPMGAMWAWVQRAGQQPQAVQYAVHEQVESQGEGYTDSGLLYTIQANTVVAMRAYGLNKHIDESAVRENLSRVEAVSRDQSYMMYKKSLDGGDVTAFEREDLIFSGMDFLSLTPDNCYQVLGEPLEDVWMEDGESGFLRALTYEYADFTFTFDLNKQNGRLMFVDIFGQGLEGPRGTRLGESFSDILQRFMHSQSPYDGSMTEVLYGNTDSNDYGVAEYQDGGFSTLRYVTGEGMDEPVTLYLSFEMDELTEIMIYY